METRFLMNLFPDLDASIVFTVYTSRYLDIQIDFNQPIYRETFIEQYC